MLFHVTDLPSVILDSFHDEFEKKPRECDV